MVHQRHDGPQFIKGNSNAGETFFVESLAQAPCSLEI